MVYDINGYKPIPTGTTGGWERLADEASRETYASILAFRLFGQGPEIPSLSQ